MAVCPIHIHTRVAHSAPLTSTHYITLHYIRDRTPRAIHTSPLLSDFHSVTPRRHTSHFCFCLTASDYYQRRPRSAPAGAAPQRQPPCAPRCAVSDHAVSGPGRASHSEGRREVRGATERPADTETESETERASARETGRGRPIDRERETERGRPTQRKKRARWRPTKRQREAGSPRRDEEAVERWSGQPLSYYSLNMAFCVGC